MGIIVGSPQRRMKDQYDKHVLHIVPETSILQVGVVNLSSRNPACRKQRFEFGVIGMRG